MIQIPETGSPKEFKAVVLREVRRCQCQCGKWFVPGVIGSSYSWDRHYCPDCVGKLRDVLALIPEILAPDYDPRRWLL
jgi:hypothetical protein